MKTFGLSEFQFQELGFTLTITVFLEAIVGSNMEAFGTLPINS